MDTVKDSKKLIPNSESLSFCAHIMAHQARRNAAMGIGMGQGICGELWRYYNVIVSDDAVDRTVLTIAQLTLNAIKEKREKIATLLSDVDSVDLAEKRARLVQVMKLKQSIEELMSGMEVIPDG